MIGACGLSDSLHTIVGPADDADNFQHELRGIIPRTFEYLFNHIARQKELVGHCKFCFIYVFTITLLLPVIIFI